MYVLDPNLKGGKLHTKLHMHTHACTEKCGIATYVHTYIPVSVDAVVIGGNAILLVTEDEDCCGAAVISAGELLIDPCGIGASSSTGSSTLKQSK